MLRSGLLLIYYRCTCMAPKVLLRIVLLFLKGVVYISKELGIFFTQKLISVLFGLLVVFF